MQVTVTCYGGANEIGGNKILLEAGETRWMLDFGKSFGRYGDFFDGVFVRERVGRGLLDVLALGLVPPLRGLLRDDLIPALSSDEVETWEIQPTGRQRKTRMGAQVRASAQDRFWEAWKQRVPGAYRDLRRDGAPPVDWLFLSHAHQDHISDLQYVTADVPVATSCMTAFIGKVLVDTGPSALGGVPYLSPRTPRPAGELASASDLPQQGRMLHFLERSLEGSAQDGPLDSPAGFWSFGGSRGIDYPVSHPAFPSTVRTYPVDHSLLGALGMAVETEAGWIGYSGDLRFHGAQAQSTWAFAEALGELRPAALLCEGTRLTAENRTTETQVAELCLKAVREAEGSLAVADFAPRNVERLLMFLDIAGETSRRLLVQPKDAYLLRAMHLADPRLPDVMSDHRVALYADPKVTLQGWEKVVRERYAASMLTPQDVRRQPAGCLLALSLTDMADLLDIEYLMQGKPGGAYIFSNSQAYDDEQMVDLVRLWNWTQHLGLTLHGLRPDEKRGGRVVSLTPVEGYHASGHAGASELVEFVRLARPQRLIAIHTENPARWQALLAGQDIELVLPEYAETIRL
jgi:ribonuclease J